MGTALSRHTEWTGTSQVIMIISLLNTGENNTIKYKYLQIIATTSVNKVPVLGYRNLKTLIYIKGF